MDDPAVQRKILQLSHYMPVGLTFSPLQDDNKYNPDGWPVFTALLAQAFLEQVVENE